VKRLVALTAGAVLVTASLTTAVPAAAAPVAGRPPATIAPAASPPTAIARAQASTSATRYVAARPATLHASADDAFVQHAVISTREGLQYIPYDRTYKGVPVAGGDFVVVTDSSGRVLSVAVAQSSMLDLSTSPKLTAARAAGIARTKLTTVDRVESTRLVVQAHGSPRLAYESVVAGKRGPNPSRLHVFVDAQNGTVIAADDEVKDGTGTAAINGPNPVFINTSGSGTSFSMTDTAHPGIACRNINTNTVLTGPDDVWGNGNGTSIETGCVDALFDVQREWDMLSTWLGRNGINGTGRGFPIKMGLADVNAFWDGSTVSVGHNQAGSWISSLDVVGHEFGHAVDSTTPGGASANGVSEATGDIFGALTEWFTNEPAAFDPPDFTVGEEVNLDGTGPIRFMYDPSQAGDPNCYSSSIPSAETHAAAGPFNHWFYLSSMGSNPTNGQPTSPTCNGATVTGLGIQTAGRIFYNAMLSKTSGMTYLRYRTATLTAAKNLFPGSCTQFDTVKAAWNAVSVPAQAGDPTCTTAGTVAVTNPGNESGATGSAITPFTLSASPAATYTWSATGLPPGLSIGSSSGAISGTPSAAGSYSVTTTATSAAGSGSTSFTFTISGGGGGGSCASSGQKLGNPGFETGSPAPWTMSTGVINSSGSQPAHAGAWDAWLNGYGTAHTDTVSQSVSLPAGCTNYSLTFWLHVDSAETTTTAQFDRLTVKAGGTTLATYSNLNKATGYAQKSFNVGAFAGQTVTITFTGTEDGSLKTSFVIDDTALTLG
jgi:Zn-dependent metalloprotease